MAKRQSFLAFRMYTLNQNLDHPQFSPSLIRTSRSKSSWIGYPPKPKTNICNNTCRSSAPTSLGRDICHLKQEDVEQLTTACCSSLPSSSSSSPRTSGSPKRFSAARFSLSSSSSSVFFSFSKLLSKISLDSEFSAFAAALLLFFPFLQFL